MEALTIRQTFTVGGRTFDSEADAQAYALAEHRKRQATEILSKVRRVDPRSLASAMSNEELVGIVAANREAFAQILAVLNGEVE
ncbi:MAG: hypothetical protein VKM34_04140 [Cyanobacteriota bacterium]|nr:hypothetical protein [Cyanobacteriota bacterium]